MQGNIFHYITLSFVAIVISACSGSEEQNENSNEENVQSTDFTYEFSEKYELKSIKPPITSADVALNAITTSNKKEELIVMESGSFIDIPENAFVDKDGNLVDGDIKVEYREFADPIDILAAGIPMALGADEDGIDLLQSAGMVEILATADGEEVFPNEENPILVGMGSQMEGDFPLYQFEEGEGWTETNSTNLMDVAQMDSVRDIVVPPKPRLILPEGTYYNITTATVQSKPELAAYEGYSFTPLYYEDAQKIQHEFLKDLKVQNQGNGYYLVTIVPHYGTEVKASCVRAYEMEEYNAKMKEWRGAYWESMRLKRALERIEDPLAAKQNLYLRSFEVESFGVTNCDRTSRAQFQDFTYEINGEDGTDWSLICIDYTDRLKFACTAGYKIGVNPFNDYAIFALKGLDVYASSVSQCRTAFSDDHFTFEIKKIGENIDLEELGRILAE